MSPRAAQRLLFAGGLLMLPTPVLLLGPGWVPPLRLLQLGLASLAFGVVESARGALPAVAGLLLGQAVLYAALLWVGAALLARALRRLPPRAVAALTWSVLAASLLLTASADVYQTPFAAERARSGLFGVFR